MFSNQSLNVTLINRFNVIKINKVLSPPSKTIVVKKKQLRLEVVGAVNHSVWYENEIKRLWITKKFTISNLYFVHSLIQSEISKTKPISKNHCFSILIEQLTFSVLPKSENIPILKSELKKLVVPYNFTQQLSLSVSSTASPWQSME